MAEMARGIVLPRAPNAILFIYLNPQKHFTQIQEIHDKTYKHEFGKAKQRKLNKFNTIYQNGHVLFFKKDHYLNLDWAYYV